jgi:hypothetical protein
VKSQLKSESKIEARAEHIVDAQEIGPIEEIERLDGEFDEAAFFGEETPRDAQVKAVVRLAQAGVAPGLTGAIALRTPVGVGVEAEQQIEGDNLRYIANHIFIVSGYRHAT